MIAALLLTAFSVLAKLIEDCRKFNLTASPNGDRLRDVHGLYESFNCHLPFAIAMLGLVIAPSMTGSAILTGNLALVLLLIVLAGAGSKGAFSAHKPDRLRWSDNDAFFGFFIPNALGMMAVCLTISVNVPTLQRYHRAWHLFGAMVVGLIASWLIGILIGNFFERGLSADEQRRLHSLKVIDECCRLGPSLTPDQSFRLHSAVMDYVMSTKSRKMALKRLHDLGQRLGPAHNQLIANSKAMIEDRFQA